MNRVCPACQRTATVDSPYCPACGAPMNEEAQKQEENVRVNSNISALLPMKWHKFIKFVYIPLNLIMSIVNLTETIPMLTQFDASLYKLELLSLVQWSLRLDIFVGAFMIPILAMAEAGLIKMKKYGPRALLSGYLAGTIYGFCQIVLLSRAELPLLTAVLNALELGLMFILNLIYYRKRRDLFS